MSLDLDHKDLESWPEISPVGGKAEGKVNYQSKSANIKEDAYFHESLCLPGAICTLAWMLRQGSSSVSPVAEISISFLSARLGCCLGP